MTIIINDKTLDIKKKEIIKSKNIICLEYNENIRMNICSSPSITLVTQSVNLGSLEYIRKISKSIF